MNFDRAMFTVATKKPCILAQREGGHTLAILDRISDHFVVLWSRSLATGTGPMKVLVSGTPQEVWEWVGQHVPLMAEVLIPWQEVQDYPPDVQLGEGL